MLGKKVGYGFSMEQQNLPVTQFLRHMECKESLQGRFRGGTLKKNRSSDTSKKDGLKVNREN
jgi:hypothetical protein